ncbi:PhzF family phenazine biosynthesis protein [Hoeflea prorocentri]|uniref:PhzF family phenazine biosynthesis protein n=1 Tax=Hoeflea prorocentri TaxID=1922333 RepID=A0A9X3UJN4_9HYPH|nr:PhzF family phenazine biosynthesis protein [Hoeflea prorocentri]MCY6380001.1 PhzF family phenazine biosynthesis protein [Hoeflea prorocentri]MDA5397801.1 PhzF family phenazine biosynthesis protein [Hoeflea prorocentri]
MPRQYAIYDVFSSDRLAGNPLAVVFDAEGLSDEAMQQIAGEFNLSETVFVLPAENPAHGAKLRIFTPGRELPFAGHPTVGAAIALAEKKSGSDIDIDLMSVLEEGVGPVRTVAKLQRGEPSFAEFDLPRLSSRIGADVSKEAVAAALQIEPHELGFENHQISFWNAGVPFLMVPVHDLSIAAKARCDGIQWEQLAPIADGQLADAFVYCRGGVAHDAHFHCRMFAPHAGIPEDPATGSAAAAFSGAIHLFDELLDGHHALLIEQGVEMGRPSKIHLHLEVDGGKIVQGRIGGNAVKVAEGSLLID